MTNPSRGVPAHIAGRHCCQADHLATKQVDLSLPFFLCLGNSWFFVPFQTNGAGLVSGSEG